MPVPHTTIAATKVANYEGLMIRRGSYYFEKGAVYFSCPCGCWGIVRLPVDGTPSWKWNQDEDRPTLEPSIRRMDGCKWHGFLTDGWWTPCGDSGQ